ncbi:efflux RND transporter periplasmic adaptor subunit [Luteibacter sp. 9135]|uniref:efflux RND transporter periplasmic adaptor subunit n=1 Tax=Luteibacter sp. 9135 TaxID=1500893 RepID=UPI00056A15AF|nr:efflux RND transporter periplasmic adaptor subunit [Luteibacter sp. 9135]
MTSLALRLALVPFALVTLTGALAGCSHPPSAAPPVPAFTVEHGVVKVGAGSPLRRALTIAPVRVDTAASHVTWPTTVEADPVRTVAIVSPGTGRIARIWVGLGDRVEKGQVLLTLTSVDIADARADERKAVDTLGLAREALDRAQKVSDAGGASTRDLEAARSASAQAIAEEARARARLAALAGGADAVAKDGSVAVRAPLAGVVTALGVAPGALVADATTALLTISDTGHAWVTAYVPEDQAGWVHRGSTAALTFIGLPGVVLQGRVEAIDPALDGDTRRLKAHFVVAGQEDHLRPNMFGQATFDAPDSPHVLVPQSALVMDNDRLSVFLERAPWCFERRTVEAGREVGADVEIVQGLKAGDAVVTRGGVLLQ